MWRLVPLSHPVDWLDIDSPLEALSRSSTLICLPPTGLTSDLTSWILWGLWKARNLLTFDNRATPTSSVVNVVVVSVREWSLAQVTTKSNDHASRTIEVPPMMPHALITCNSNASWSKETRKAGLGWIMEVSRGGLIEEGQSHSWFVSSPLMAEALAIKEVLVTASHKSTPNVWIRFDSLELIRAINSNTFPMELYGILKDIESLSSAFVYFSYVPRLSNAHAECTMT